MLRKSLAVVFVIAALLSRYGEAKPGRSCFVGTNGTHFVLDGRPFYFSGFNAYWLMYMASDPITRVNVTDTFEQASMYGMNVVRTWAFSDGVNDSRPLQATPGNYSEIVFKGLDFVVSEAKKHGLYLILSLVNNWNDYGGKKQYVQWAKDQGQSLTNDDDFFTSNITKGYYKYHVKSVLTRVNSINGVAYKDDLTILGWELMNEPRCQSDLSGRSIQDWVSEMSAYVKSIDENHLVEIGLEGYYGELMMPEKKQNNPGYEVGTDFISNNLIPHVDIATIHLYPDQWLRGSNETMKAKFVKKWIKAHIADSKSILGKPILLTEFGKSLNSTNYNVHARDKYFRDILNRVYNNARSGGACGGALFWQVMATGMRSWSDSYDVVLQNSPSTAAVISKHSSRIASLNKE
ncbi:hypothetical protein CASFOL_033854 [Castilleja foliolosa]|uniref:mannan endo-1,4-beta-mannosidase n=1 Tax=Castilleja foliolosa TaxID=1961234 RepID=A0ABD3BZ09_9LAMI